MGKPSLKALLFAGVLLPVFAFSMQLCTWCYEKEVEAKISELEQSGCVIWAIHCENPEADIFERRWVIEYEKMDWNKEKP